MYVAELCRHVNKHPAARRLVVAALQRDQAAAGAVPHEAIRGVVLVAQPFTYQNGLLTAMLKPRRAALAGRFGALLRAAAADLGTPTTTTTTACDPQGKSTDFATAESAESAVCALLEKVLGRPVLPDEDLSTCGLDSMSATRFLALLSATPRGGRLSLGALFRAGSTRAIAQSLSRKPPPPQRRGRLEG
jgi:hypothetical protein